MASSCGRRNSLGRALPVDGSAEIDPTSTCPKPSAESKGTACALLSDPAARPIGFDRCMPATSVLRHSSLIVLCALIHEQNRRDELANAAARMASWCAVSASNWNKRGRSKRYILSLIHISEP